MKPTPDVNAGAEAERRAIRNKVRSLIAADVAANQPVNYNLQKVLDFIEGRAKRTAKRTGGVGRK